MKKKRDSRHKSPKSTQMSPLLAGLIGAFVSGILVWLITAQLYKSDLNDTRMMLKDHMDLMEKSMHSASGMDMSMSDMTKALEGKYGDEFDRIFLEEMIPHHQGAVDMAKLAEAQAKHQEIKQLSQDILKTQTKEINAMKSWQETWGY